MKIFLMGAVTSANKKQLKKYNFYKQLLHSYGELTTPDDIWDYRNKCKEDTNKTKLEIDKLMTDFDLARIKESDLLICDISSQSIGVGIELGTAYVNNNKVVFCFEKGSIISNMITGVFNSSKFIEYKNLEDLKNKLIPLLNEIINK